MTIQQSASGSAGCGTEGLVVYQSRVGVKSGFTLSHLPLNASNAQ
jgi:hypothetical protein